ncbi:hypothetical protein FACS189429_5130 [Bacteroidia bacterium]|nr:hypothetical protein FACS189429_5130 [Bacteroidia bacterium]
MLYFKDRETFPTGYAVHYLCGGAVLIQETGQPEQLLYGYSDYQASLTALVNESGTIVERYAYDPWGRRRDPANWKAFDTRRTAYKLSRGYTGHEHLDKFNVINMNGRVYDPLTAQFFSPDPYIQAPDNWLNYNRYSYCLNNPFKYTDPSGENPLLFAAFWAVFSGMQQGAIADMNGGSFWGGFAKGAAISLASSALTYGIGSAFGATGSFWNEAGRAVAHGVAGGGLNAAQGGNFWQGFAVSSISSFAGSGFMAAGMDRALVPFATGAIGAGTAWAVGSDAFGGFSTGFGIGALNHALHGGPPEDGIINPDGTLTINGVTYACACPGVEIMPSNTPKLPMMLSFSRIGALPLDYEAGKWAATQWAAYRMNVNIYGNRNAFTIAATSYNSMVDGGIIVPSAKATLMVNNKVLSTQPLTLKGTYLTPQGTIPIGDVSFKAPSTGSVSRVNA